MYEHLFSYRTETIIRHRAANGSKGREIRNEARSNQLMYSVVQKHCEAFIRVPVSSCQYLSVPVRCQFLFRSTLLQDYV